MCHPGDRINKISMAVSKMSKLGNGQELVSLCKAGYSYYGTFSVNLNSKYSCVVRSFFSP